MGKFKSEEDRYGIKRRDVVYFIEDEELFQRTDGGGGHGING